MRRSILVTGEQVGTRLVSSEVWGSSVRIRRSFVPCSRVESLRSDSWRRARHEGKRLFSARRAEGLQKASPDVVLHLAAQSHVDDSISRPMQTIESNVIGTQVIASTCER